MTTVKWIKDRDGIFITDKVAGAEILVNAAVALNSNAYRQLIKQVNKSNKAAGSARIGS